MTPLNMTCVQPLLLQVKLDSRYQRFGKTKIINQDPVKIYFIVYTVYNYNSSETSRQEAICR